MEPKNGAGADKRLPPDFFRDLVESSDDLIWQCDTEGRFIYLNAAWKIALGYDLSQMIGYRFTDFMAPGMAVKDMGTFKEVLRKGGIRDYETVYVKKDGGRIELSFNARMVRDAAGAAIGVRGVARDISVPKAMERKVAESEERYRQMVQNSPLGMHFYELRGDDLVFIGHNPAADSLLGVDNALFIGKKIEEAFPPLAGTEVPDRYRAAARDGVAWCTEQVAYKDDRIDGAFEVRAFQTAPGRMVAFFLEITARKRAEEALKREKERIAVTLASIGDGVIATDTRGTITIMNKVAEELTGWKSAEAEGKPLDEAFDISNEVTGERSESPVSRVLKTAGIVELENHTVLRSKDGRIIRISDSGAPILDPAGRTVGVVLVFRDVTEKAKMQEAIQRSQRLESLGILAGGIAHDFNNLLGGVFGFMDLAIEASTEAPVRAMLEKAFIAMERAKGLTHQLLTFAKGGEPVLEVADLRGIIEESARFALSGTNVKVDFDFQAGLWPCEVDVGQFGQVIDNIVINARQAMPRGGTIRIEARNHDSKDGSAGGARDERAIVVSIHDDGEGIPRANLPYIFDPFFTTKIGGNGLGLATCYSIISRHGGSIDAESTQGQGSVFRIYLPAASEPIPRRAHAAAIVAPSTGRIIVLDDEKPLREILGEMLRRLGFSPVCVDTAEAAVSAFKEKDAGTPLVAAVLDLTIPGGRGGKEVALELHRLAPGLPVFVASGYSDDPVMSDPGAYGFAGSITKPFRMSDVARIIRAGLASSGRTEGGHDR